MKKLIFAFMILGSVTLFAEEKLILDKQVTGINKESIEKREVKEKRIDLKEAKVDGKDIRVSNKKIKNSEENLEIVNSNDNIKKELATDVKKDSSIWKYIIGALGVAAIAISL